MGLAEKLAQIQYGKSADPRAPENINDEDFQKGYADRKARPGENCTSELIQAEWFRRGKPAFDSDEWEKFSNYKRGLWAYTFTELEQTTKKEF